MGKSVFSIAAGRIELGALFRIKPGSVSGASAIDGAGGRVDGKVEGGKDTDAKLRELVVVAGTRGEGYSNKFEPGKLDAPVGREALNPGYCIGCCMEGDFDSPGGGRSRDCWCTWGSPLGGP